MLKHKRLLSVLAFALLLMGAVLVVGAAGTFPASTADTPEPLPNDCQEVTEPGEDPPACCAFGYVYYEGVPVAGASVRIESPYGALDTATASGGLSGDPYYTSDLSSTPLLVSPGDVITITVSYSDMVSARTWTVQSDGQHVDLGLVAGYQAPGPILPLTTDALYTEQDIAPALPTDALPPAETWAGALSTISDSPIFTDTNVITVSQHISRTFDLPFGDADNDGYLDLAVGNHDLNQVCWNNGDYTFDCEEAFGGSATFDVDWGDMDGDSYLDLVVANSMGHSNLVCLNNGDRTFTCTSFSRCTGGAGSPCHTALGDVDKDGDLDIALGIRWDQNLIYFNDGTGTSFPITATVCSDYDYETWTMDLEFGDVDNDDDPDLVAVGNGSGYVSINDPPGTFTECRRFPFRPHTMSVALDYADDDVYLDVAMGNPGGDPIEIYLNDGHGYFTETLLVGPVSDETVDLAWGDVDNDGDPDLAVVNYEQPNVVYFNDPVTTTNSITFTRKISFGLVLTYTNSVAFGDVDNDGDLDLAVGNDGQQNVVYINTLNAPNAAFTATPRTGPAPLNVQFTDQSSGDIISWDWTFGDGGISGARHPSHIYESAGIYTVSLTVSGPRGSDTETKTDYITVSDGVLQPPEASISFIWYPSYPAPAVQGQDTIYFNGSGTDRDEGGAHITAYVWTSSIDGQLSTQEDFTKPAMELSAGAHTIRFKVQDDEGEWSQEVIRYLTVQAPRADVRTLILVNRQKLETLYSASEAGDVMDKLNTLADHDSVNGLVVQVENAAAVAAAYAAWDAEPTSTAKANAVTAAIKDVIAAQWATHPDLEYLVIVGDDRAIPFRRVIDQTRHPESNYGSVSSTSTVGAALRDDMTLTDDYYADAVPTVPDDPDWDGHALYIPDLGTGRLIETSAEIIAQIDAFLDGDAVAAGSAIVTGYDFVKDGAQAMCSKLSDDDITTDCTLIGLHWDRDDFIAKVLNTRHDIVSINGHAGHPKFCTPVDLSCIWDYVSSSDVAGAPPVHTRAIFYTIGCHSGLNVPPTNPYEPLDTAQAWVQHQVNYIALTGYGWGYVASVGLSEQLMLDFTEHLVYGQSATLGQALAAAKQEYYLNEREIDYYDEKIMIESTLYGLPMYRYTTPTAVATQGQSQGATPIKEEQVTVLGDGLTVNSISYQFPALTAESTDDGLYYTFGGLVHTGDGEPIQPKYTADLSFPETKAHGAVFKSGVYTDVTSFDPVVAQAINEHVAPAEPSFDAPGWYPALPHRLNRLERGDHLVTLLGQFNAQSQTERVYDQLGFDIYYHTSSDDWATPTVSSVLSSANASATDITVECTDASGIYKVVIAHTADDGYWHSIDLAWDSGSGMWTGSIPTAASIEYLVQVVDNAGNVASTAGSWYKVYLPLILKN